MRYRFRVFEVINTETKNTFILFKPGGTLRTRYPFDQFYRHNLLVRKTIDALVETTPETTIAKYLSNLCLCQGVGSVMESITITVPKNLPRYAEEHLVHHGRTTPTVFRFKR
jgi:hypothetical protein